MHPHCSPNKAAEGTGNHGRFDLKNLEAFIRRKIEEGRYSTEEEVVADTLCLMQVRDEVLTLKRELRNALDRGYEDVVAGRAIEFEADGQIDALFASL